MQVGDFVQWDLTRFHGVALNPSRGYVHALDGEWVIAKRVMGQGETGCPFATLRRSEVTVLPQQELVRVGATLLT